MTSVVSQSSSSLTMFPISVISSSSYFYDFGCTSSGPIYKKHLTFLIHCINDVFGLYSRLDTSITQII